MLKQSISRRLMVVPLADNNHGKTTMLTELAKQASRRELKKLQRGVHVFTSPWGRKIDALVFVRSYQETLRKEHGSVVDSLAAIDKDWYQRDLVIFPSHVEREHCEQIIEAGHEAGFDLVAVPVFLKPTEVRKLGSCLALNWDLRWTVSNDSAEDYQGQLEALGHDLWSWIAGAIEAR